MLILTVVLLLLLLFLDGTLLDVVGEFCGRHSVGLLAVGLELGAPELGLSKCCGGVDHGLLSRGKVVELRSWSRLLTGARVGGSGAGGWETWRQWS